MGWFDNLKKEREESLNISSNDPDEENNVSAISSEGESEIDHIDIDDVPVIEREVSTSSYDSQGNLIENGATQSSEDNVSRETSENEPPVSLRAYKDKKPVTRVIGSTEIVAIINQKGGVGKSTTAIDLAAALGEMGKQVLLIDLDPQGNASSGLGIEKNLVPQCIYDVIINQTPIKDAIIPDVCEGLDIVPATINLAGAEVELVSEMASENRLKNSVGSLRGLYDYIFIDCPPSLGLLTVNALVAADKLLIPIQCEFYALEGVTKLLDSMKRVKSLLNPSLEIFGILLTMYDGRTTLAKQVVKEVQNYFGKLVFDTIIPRTVKLSEAPSYGLPITQYDPNGKGAQSYKNLAKEVIARG